MTKDIEVGSKEWYAKHQHVVKGSVREATAADKRHLGHVHNRVCVIKCTHKGCKEQRLINTQDAFQVMFCEPHRKEARAARRSEKAKAKKNKKSRAA